MDLTDQNPLFRRVPMYSILGLITRTKKNLNFGRLRQINPKPFGDAGIRSAS